MTTRATAPSINEATLRRISQAQGEPSWLLERRLEALRVYEAMSMPDPLEEEWRRTDISGFDLDAALASLGVDTDRRTTTWTTKATPAASPSRAATTSPTSARRRCPKAPSSATCTPPRTSTRSWSSATSTAWSSRPSGSSARCRPLPGVAAPSSTCRAASRWSCRCATPSKAPGAPVPSPHLLIIAEENSSVSIVQETLSQDGGEQALVSGAVEIICRPYARVRFVEDQAWGDNVYNFSTIRARLDQGAELTAALVGLGGRLTRTKVDAQLWGEGSAAELLGLTYGDGKQHFNYTTLQDHVAPRTVAATCCSRQRWPANRARSGTAPCASARAPAAATPTRPAATSCSASTPRPRRSRCSRSRRTTSCAVQPRRHGRTAGRRAALLPRIARHRAGGRAAPAGRRLLPRGGRPPADRNRQGTRLQGDRGPHRRDVDRAGRSTRRLMAFVRVASNHGRCAGPGARVQRRRAQHRLVQRQR